MKELSLYFNPNCSKCRTARGILKDQGLDALIVDYVNEPPTVAQLRTLMEQLRISDPRAMMRTGESVYRTLGLAEQTGDALLQAIADHPILVERPIAVRDGRAVIARPPERVLELLTS